MSETNCHIDCEKHTIHARQIISKKNYTITHLINL